MTVSVSGSNFVSDTDLLVAGLGLLNTGIVAFINHNTIPFLLGRPMITFIPSLTYKELLSIRNPCLTDEVFVDYFATCFGVHLLIVYCSVDHSGERKG